MKSRPLLLDLFCGAGGCAVGYHRAGFDVVGVDIKPQPRYPFRMVVADALKPPFDLTQFDAIHASPPCQAYSQTTRFRNGDHHPRHVDDVRRMLDKSGKPWVIENVPGSPLSGYSAVLCGLMFGIKVFRHRLFESNFLMLAPAHPPHGSRRAGVDGYCCVAGNGGAGMNKAMRERARASCQTTTMATWRKAMGIDWMKRDELSQAIPPAYTEYIGRQLMRVITENAGNSQSSQFATIGQ